MSNQPPPSSIPPRARENGHTPPDSVPPRRKSSPWKIFGIIVAVVILAVIGFGISVLFHALRGIHGAKRSDTSIVDTLGSIDQIAVNPKEGFPGQNKIVICCMGIDDNWTNSDEVYTAGSRTDTLFLMTLDFTDKKVTMLSIPRDAYVPIAGTHYSDKINAAFASGGPVRTEATIRQWLGINPDYYIVLNIDATKKMVDALGGVDLDVEHQMNYDDQWGHLHVHLKPGFQHLDGDQAVGFARFRHGNHGVTPEDGDERRMYRQHVLLRAMIAKAKTFSSIMKANSLIDTAMSCVRTDMTRTQLFDLAAIFHAIDQNADVTATSLHGEDARGPYGAYIMQMDTATAKEYADWLVNGDTSAARALTPVIVRNATKVSGLAATAAQSLHAIGFTHIDVTTVNSASNTATTINDGGVVYQNAGADIANALNLTNTAITNNKVQPNHLGWAPPPVVTVTIGQDYAATQTKPAPSTDANAR